MRNNRAKKRGKQGRCANCGRPARPGSRYCPRCVDKLLAQVKERGQKQ